MGLALLAGYERGWQTYGNLDICDFVCREIANRLRGLPDTLPLESDVD
jgi:hypothetical protein